MKFFDRLERRFGRFAVPNLIIYLLLFYLAGFILNLVNPSYYFEHLSLNMERIFHGEVWRLVTFLIYPPTTSILWFLLEMFILYSLGTNLERLWGRFYFNLYIFIGLFAIVLASLLVYVIGGRVLLLTADNLYMSLLLAFGITVPEMQFLIYFILPVKAKYLTIFYGILILYQLITGDWAARTGIIASLANFIIFFLLIRRPAQRVRQTLRRQEFYRKAQEAQRQAQQQAARPMGARHICAVCGRTDQSNPELEFRYCTRCAGGREYCMDHLYTHVHVTANDTQNPSGNP